jgi:hypothetical protein
MGYSCAGAAVVPRRLLRHFELSSNSLAIAAAATRRASGRQDFR